MLTTEMSMKAAELNQSHDEFIKFMDEILQDIETLKFALTQRRTFVMENAFFDALNARDSIMKARAEIVE